MIKRILLSLAAIAITISANAFSIAHQVKDRQYGNGYQAFGVGHHLEEDDGSTFSVTLKYFPDKNVSLFGYFIGPENALAKYNPAVDNFDILMRITLDNDEFFVVPITKVEKVSKEVDTIALLADFGQATFSSEVEEIGSGYFNAWSTLKYLNSRMYRFGIKNITLAMGTLDKETGEPIDVKELCSMNIIPESSKFIADMFDEIAELNGSKDFYTNSWEY